MSDIGPKAGVHGSTAILAGGLGTRLREEMVVRPKPMVDVGGCSILWYIRISAVHPARRLSR